MRLSPNAGLGLAIVALAAVAIFVWVPLDTDSGLVEKVRRRITIGDALAPTVAGAFCMLGGAFLLLFERGAPDQPRLTRANLGYVVQILALFALCLAVMRWLGPAVVALAEPDQTYRVLRTTAPWKYIGYVAGGALLVIALIAWIEHRLKPRTVVIGVVAALILAMLYDLPFDDLLLPPNGDV